MPPRNFKFKLQIVLDVKEKREEEEKEKLAKLFKLKADEEAVLAKLEREKFDTLEELKEKQKTGGINVEKIKMYHAHLKKLDHRITNQKLRLTEIDIAIDKQREALLEATKEKKTFEKLKEKHYDEWLKELDAEERKFIDELATIRFARDKQTE